jgi:hypothetical protein
MKISVRFLITSPSVLLTMRDISEKDIEKLIIIVIMFMKG